jgi:hypothetical protein
MIKVGSIVGLMVMPGEDWKNAHLPGTTPETHASTTTKVVETKSETTTTHSSSHLQMFVLEEFF